jgi:DeoR/GlpR family transcriptional regulator of sugar metabolism
MLRARRHAEIVRLLREAGPTPVAELVAAVGASPATVRRDLADLADQGALRRVRGGAQLVDEANGPDSVTGAGTVTDPDPDRTHPYEQVAGRDADDKAAVAARALRLVDDGAVLLLDIGTTVAALARLLRGRPVTVVTSSLAVLDVLRDDAQVELVLLGGVVRQPYRSLVGLLTETALGQVRADLAFLGTSGVRPDGEVLDSTRVEVPVKRALMAAADRSVLLADRHKFPGTGALTVGQVRDLDVVVTNDGVDGSALGPWTDEVEVLRG